MASPTPPLPGQSSPVSARRLATDYRRMPTMNRLDTAMEYPRSTASRAFTTPDISPSKSPGNSSISGISSLFSRVSTSTTPGSPYRTPISPSSLNKALPPTPVTKPLSATTTVMAVSPPVQTPCTDIGRVRKEHEKSSTSPPTSMPRPLGISGTMCSRQTRNSSPFRSLMRKDSKRSTGSPTSSPRRMGQRIGRSVKSMFSKSPVDPDSFERIEDRHWTE